MAVVEASEEIPSCSDSRGDPARQDVTLTMQDDDADVSWLPPKADARLASWRRSKQPLRPIVESAHVKSDDGVGDNQPFGRRETDVSSIEITQVKTDDEVGDNQPHGRRSAPHLLRSNDLVNLVEASGSFAWKSTKLPSTHCALEFLQGGSLMSQMLRADSLRDISENENAMSVMRFFDDPGMLTNASQKASDLSYGKAVKTHHREEVSSARRAFDKAVDTGNLESLSEALKAEVQLDMHNEAGVSALARAISAGNYNVVKMLLEHRANPRGIDQNGNTALHLALADKHVYMAKMIIDSRCSVNQTNLLNFSPMDVAIYTRHRESVLLLSENGATLSGAVHYPSEHMHIIAASSRASDQPAKSTKSIGTDAIHTCFREAKDVASSLETRMQVVLEHAANMDDNAWT
eukprot:TRINITY_DN29190_c0_g1_i1.p1 TRINITY_DN29190_c0_g1~~TRINITY_DN29190_c0_g1_i1.p1  ORF type:complete len:406 (-),score=53.82 TRINITY_DN29190_c0_g1_i1:29-1246(-)